MLVCNYLCLCVCVFMCDDLYRGLSIQREHTHTHIHEVIANTQSTWAKAIWKEWEKNKNEAQRTLWAVRNELGKHKNGTCNEPIHSSAIALIKYCRNGLWKEYCGSGGRGDTSTHTHTQADIEAGDRWTRTTKKNCCRDKQQIIIKAKKKNQNEYANCILKSCTLCVSLSPAGSTYTIYRMCGWEIEKERMTIVDVCRTCTMISYGVYFNVVFGGFCVLFFLSLPKFCPSYSPQSRFFLSIR